MNGNYYYRFLDVLIFSLIFHLTFKFLKLIRFSYWSYRYSNFVSLGARACSEMYLCLYEWTSHTHAYNTHFPYGNIFMNGLLFEGHRRDVLLYNAK